jgi:hypothetical protein
MPEPEFSVIPNPAEYAVLDNKRELKTNTEQEETIEGKRVGDLNGKIMRILFSFRRLS